MAKRPWMKWYPADWRADAGLRRCSLAARGLWVDLLGYMHEAEPYGHLVFEGAPPSLDDLVDLIGKPKKAIVAALAELTDRRVCDVVDGVIISRRMVRDHAKEEKDRENGKGGGNPALKGGDNPPDNGGDKAHIPEARYQKPDKKGLGNSTVSEVRPASLGSRLAEDWALPADWLAWAQANSALQNPEIWRQSERFRDFWHGKSGKDGRKADWFATWRNWIRTADDDRAKRGGFGGKASVSQDVLGWAARGGT